ncbi:hypothetical protein MHYMCMPSP_00896 [Hyalomma marginatum]|uniref:Uncharacterized protein n=1 Tax=Hyalomma marginatum TaxID=34627 RepID=A0A8S4C2K1_9ACAR|nr:hypothetical protein MHYMCMPASI_00710 [Hyalomma marginatum]CAG7594501.1 hypothetical protein MHYMCMPSP_00896 [Hyalomma marginatum]
MGAVIEVLASLILGIGAFLGYKSYQHKLPKYIK